VREARNAQMKMVSPHSGNRGELFGTSARVGVDDRCVKKENAAQMSNKKVLVRLI
jgi:hypothetical protein